MGCPSEATALLPEVNNRKLATHNTKCKKLWLLEFFTIQMGSEDHRALLLTHTLQRVLRRGQGLIKQNINVIFTHASQESSSVSHRYFKLQRRRKHNYGNIISSRHLDNNATYAIGSLQKYTYRSENYVGRFVQSLEYFAVCFKGCCTFKFK